MTRVGVTPLLVLLSLGVIGSEVVSTDVEGHPRFDEPRGADRTGSEPVHLHLQERVLLAAEVPAPTGEEGNPDGNGGGGGGPEVSDNEGDSGGGIPEGDTDVEEEGPDISVGVREERVKEVVGGDLERPHVNLAIAVPSVRPERREAIRKTWLKWGDDRVVLRFFTEPPDGAENENSQEISALLAEESQTHGDIIIQDMSAGMNFGVKLLEAMKWMSSQYSFDFFLRLDDDYFLCLEHLLNELSCLLISGAQQSPIYSGTRGCGTVPSMDEAYILLSSVIVDRILAASDLQCHALGTTTAGAWLRIGGPGNPEGDVAWVSDRRLNWMGGSWRRFKPNNRACEHYIGFHHTYSDEMNELIEQDECISVDSCRVRTHISLRRRWEVSSHFARVGR
ncbi:unnamed protein product [Scytosiphon promiscuus]